MERRSTNDLGYVHHQGDIVSNVGSSHGVRLTGGSTGGIVESIGDDTNVSLRLRSQGTGGVLIGSTAQSTTPMLAVQRYLVQYTVPALSSGPAASESTVTVTGLTTASILVLQNRLINNSTGAVSLSARCSTVDELTIQFENQSISSLSGSTQSAYLLQIRF